MNKEETIEMVKQLRVNRPIINEIEKISKRYRNAGEEHNLDGNILFELGLLQEKLTSILWNFYAGDIEKKYNNDELTYEEYSKKLECEDNMNGPYCNFGYMTSDFIDSLEDLSR